MRHDDDRIGLLELADQFLHLQSGDRVESGTWFIHQQDLRLVRYCPCDAEPLLLSSREIGRRSIKYILDFVP